MSGEDRELHFMTSQITVTRVMSETGEDQHRIETTPDMTMIEALGMLRLAEDSLLNEREGWNR